MQWKCLCYPLPQHMSGPAVREDLLVDFDIDAEVRKEVGGGFLAEMEVVGCSVVVGCQLGWMMVYDVVR